MNSSTRHNNPERLLRTLQRRVKHWQATQDPNKDVIFRQSVPAGHQGLSDFTHPDTAITIAGEPFAHLLYQFRLAFSGWRHVHIVQGGESCSALADGLQNALHKLGGVPKEHRTDSLSAAYVNTAQKQRLTDDYQALCQHYGMRPTTNNPGVSHENGAVEAPHGSLKRRIEQAAKPQVFRFSQFRDDILPGPRYHQLWKQAEQQFTPRESCKWMVAMLRFAADYDCEGTLVSELLHQAEQARLPGLKSLQTRYLKHTTPPDIPVRQHPVADYDRLLTGQWKTREVTCG